MDITVRVEVQYVAPAHARVRDVLHMFRTPAWVRFMVRYISPHLKSAAPADRSVLAALAPVPGPTPDGSCVICMSAFADDKPHSADDTSGSADAVRLPCGHCFHSPCIRSWLQLRSTCPSCRGQLRSAFAGSYAVRTLNSALRLRPEHRRLRRDAVLDASLGLETVRAVVHVTLGPVPAASAGRQRQYPCVLNALLLDDNGDRFDPPRLLDKSDAGAGADAGADADADAVPGTRRSARVRERELDREEPDTRAKRLRVA